MDNNFQALAEEFVNGVIIVDMDDEELENAARSFLSKRGIDEAWMDEAIEVLKDTYNDCFF